MEKKLFFTTANFSRISIGVDLVIPFALYYAMVNQLSIIAWALLGLVVVTRLALVIAPK